MLEDFTPDLLPHSIHRRFPSFEFEIFAPHRHRRGFILFTVQAFQVRMLKCLFDCGSVAGRESKKQADEINGHLFCLRQCGLIGLGLGPWQAAEEFVNLGAPYASQVLGRGPPGVCYDESKLMLGVGAREQGPAAEHLGEDAAHGPDVELLQVSDLRAGEQLWAAIPPRADVVRQR